MGTLPQSVLVTGGAGFIGSQVVRALSGPELARSPSLTIFPPVPRPTLPGSATSTA